MVSAWQQVFRAGIAPQLSNSALQALQEALRRDDPALIQGATTLPAAGLATDAQPVVAACAIALAGWRGEGLPSVGAVEDYLAGIVHAADRALGEPAAVRPFFQFADSVDRPTFRRVLLAEVNRALAWRQAHSPGQSGTG
jgi:hypothetical protein